MSKDSPSNFEVLIVGGGVVGLSAAWLLAKKGLRVGVVDRSQMGREASWAGAGMIPPGVPSSHFHLATPLEQLAGLSSNAYANWSTELREATGIDNEYRRCGAVQISLSEEEAASLHERTERWKLTGIQFESLASHAISEIEPEIGLSSSAAHPAFLLPAEAQIRNPRHLAALESACRLEGVQLLANNAVSEFEISAGRVQQAVTSLGDLYADRFLLTGGCWTGELAQTLGIEIPLKPIRGQMVLLKGPPGLVRHNIGAGQRYIVPRRDGHILLGSTMEDVGFEKGNTEEAVEELLAFGRTLIPALAKLPVEQTWSGLRPATESELPLIGPIAGFENAWIATGHLRSGLQMSVGTAQAIADLIQGQKPCLELSSFGIDSRLSPHGIA